MGLELDSRFAHWLRIVVLFKTEAEAIKAVESNGDSLRYVNCRMFEHLINETPVRIISKAEIAEKFGVIDFQISE